jgi:SPP1 family predicted phage head-tail adaptor
MVFDSLLNNEFVVSRRRRTFDGQGGWSIDFTHVDYITGRLRPATSRERESASQQERDITHVLYVEAGEDIARGDQVIVNGLVLDVEGIREPSTSGHHLEVDCRERQVEVTEDG